MAQNSKIEWTHHTANLWWGCEEIHEGCDNCYARIFANRFTDNLWGPGSVRREIKSVWKDLDKYQRKAKELNEMHRVFVGSMMDIFEHSKPIADQNGNIKELSKDDFGEVIPFETSHLRQKLFVRIKAGEYENLIFLFLTKRPQNINKYIPTDWKSDPPKNVMFGTSIVNQQTAKKLIRDLSEVNGYKFLSVEPQIAHINLPEAGAFNAEFQRFNDDRWHNQKPRVIDWVIQGGESGAKKRPFNLAWAREMRDHCLYVGMPYFFKQIDKIQPIPDDLQIRQFPKL